MVDSLTMSGYADETVLYCQVDNTWKLTDFGLSSTATSKQAIPSRFARGTPSYRAPELLREIAEFTNKVDLWALGCILYELVALKKAFHGDWEVHQYNNPDSVLSIPVLSSSEFLQHHLSESISELLHREPKFRPTASIASRLFSSYCKILDLGATQVFIENQYYPSYVEWKELVEMHHFEPQLLFHFAKAYQEKGQGHITRELFKEIVRKYIVKGKWNEHISRNGDRGIWRNLADSLATMSQYEDSIVVYKALIDDVPHEWPLRKCIADI